MAGFNDAFSVAGVTSGQLDETGGRVILTFEGATGPVSMRLPVGELMALVSVCVGLAGQDLPAPGASDLPTIPVADWRVGVAASTALVLGLAPDSGGALAFRLTPQQAREIAAALGRGVQFAEAGDPPPRAARAAH